MSDSTGTGVGTGVEVTDDDRRRARQLLGLGSGTRTESPTVPPTDAGESLRVSMREHRVGWYVVLVLGLLGLADTLQGYAFGVMAPEIARSLGIDRSQVATLNALKTLATAALTIPLVITVQRTPEGHSCRSLRQRCGRCSP